MSAIFTEDAVYSPISLIQEGLPIPSDAHYLMFDFELVVAENNIDYFDFYLNDVTTPYFSTGGFSGTSAGSFSTDISHFADFDLPIIFSLNYDWHDQGLDSVLTIRNLEISHRAIPETASYLLMLLGLLGMLALKRMRGF